MARKYKRRSIHQNKSKRRTQFKPGHACKFFNWRNENIPENSIPPSDDSAQVQRLTTEEAEEVQYLAQTGPQHTLPFTLRPKPATEDEEYAKILDENIIVNMKQMAQFADSIHRQACSRPNIKVQINHRNGLCLTLSTVCSSCHFKTSPVIMTESVKKARGPLAGALNNMVVLPVLKSKLGIADIQLVLSCLNIKAPSKVLLQSKVNELSSKVTTINEQEMRNSQVEVARLNRLAGAENVVDVQIDTSYSARPQAGTEKAQQSFNATIEHTTKKKRTLSIAIASKICRKKKCSHEKCSKTFSTEASIASSERSLMHENLNRIKNMGHIKIRSVTTDASAQVAKAVRDFSAEHKVSMNHYQCFIHKLRTLDKHIRSLKLNSIPKKYNKAVYTSKLAQCVRIRCRMELQNLKAMKLDENNFMGRAVSAIENIVACFSGCHQHCRYKSTVCKSHLQLLYTTKFLPFGVHLELGIIDRQTIKKEIQSVLDIQALKNIKHLFNTNMCESLHSLVFNYAPKFTHWSRNFSGLCHSATHSRLHGRGKATILLAKAANIKVHRNSQMFVQLKKIDKNTHYHSKRKDTQEFKEKRFYLRKRQSNRKLYMGSLYSSDAPSTSKEDHCYGLLG